MAVAERRTLPLLSTLVLLGATLAHTSIAKGEECRDIQTAANRLACYDKEADFQNAMQQMIAVDIRLADSGASACGFVIDADRLKMRLVVADLTWRKINDSRFFSPRDLQRIGDDAEASSNATPGSDYCRAAWAQYGPDAKLPDNVFYHCKTKSAC